MTVPYTFATATSALTLSKLDANFTAVGASGNVSYTPLGTSAVVTTVQAKLRESVSVKDFGAVGDGVTNDTAAIQAALNTTATQIYFPQGSYRVVDSLLDGTPVLTSAVANRTLCGPGILTATSQVKKLITISGDNSKTQINVDGANYIGFAIFITGANPFVSNCNIKNLNGFANWGGVAIRLSFFGKDGGGVVCNNTIENLQGVGNATPGDGIGMQRGIIVESDQDCVKPVLIANNNIIDVEGEEGDSIVVISYDGVNFYNLPVNITGNSLSGWTRRGIKIQANNVTISGNTLTNDLAAYISSLQRAIDIVRGGNVTVSGNTLIRCKYQTQIGAFWSLAEADDNLSISGNTIVGVGAETNAYGPLIVVNTYGSGVVVSSNNILCPAYTGLSVSVTNTLKTLVVSNSIQTANGNWYDITASTATRFMGNVLGRDNAGELIVRYEDDFDLVADMSGVNRSLTLDQRDTVLSNGELVAQLRCRQNDASAPNTVNAALAFIAEGTIGLLGIGLYGNNGSTYGERIRMSAAGNWRPITDNAQTLGTTTERWSFVHAFIVRTHGVTVSGLTAAATAGAGARAFVTDANATTFASIVAAGGANQVPVYSDGTNWRIG
jgi:hypothetical protein